MQSYGFDLKDDGLSSDFCRIGQGQSMRERLQNGLVQANVMKGSDELRSFTDNTVWHRGGAESFVADAMLKTESGVSLHIIGKALVSFGSQPDRVLASWLRRRRALQLAGIRVPFLYSAFGGTIYEEYIASDISHAAFSVQPLINDIARTAVLLDYAGFEPLSFLSDLRNQDNKVYYVDFGSDLGDPTGMPRNRAKSQIDRILSEPGRTSCLEYYELYLWEFKRGSERFNRTQSREEC